MFDTLTLQRRWPASYDELDALGFQPTKLGAPFEKWVKNPPKGENGPRLTWCRNYKAGIDSMVAEVSLPKLMNRSNVHDLDADGVIAAVNEMGCATSEILHREFDAWDSKVVRVDACASIFVGPEVAAYLGGLQNVRIPRMTRTIQDSSVTFRSRGVRICGYDKEAEVRNQLKKRLTSQKEVELAKGLLRVEIGYRNAEACQILAEKCGKQTRTAADLLTPQVAEFALNTAMTKLTLDQSVYSKEGLTSALMTRFGPDRVTTLLGFVVAYELHGADMVKLGMMSRSTFYRLKGQLGKAGLLTTAPRKLPALRLVSQTSSRARAA